MEPNKGEESGEMYSPDDQGEYVPEAGVLSFSVQGLSDALTALDTKITVVQPPSEEFALLLEVMMADLPGHLHPPTFSWNVGMVMHSLKGNPALRDLKHVQVDDLGMAYLFFLTNRATEDSLWMPLRTSGPMLERCLLSESPALCTLLSFPFH